MNKVLLIGRLVRNPEIFTTNSGIKYTRFTIAINRQFNDNQADFIPVVAWRNQAEFVSKYMKKGSLMSVEGRFTSSTYQNSENINITRYEVTADRVDGLEPKGTTHSKSNPVKKNLQNDKINTNVNKITFEKEEKENKENVDVPWELDL